MAGKLKGFDPKQFFVTHGEKVGFGVVLVLVVLGLYGTNWVPYDREPNEITDKVAVAEAALAGANWQTDENLADERALYALDESRRPAHVVDARLAGEIFLGPFRPSQRLKKSIVEIDRPLRKPDLLPVEQLVASAARVFIELPPENLELASTEEDEETMEADEEAIADEDLPDELRERRGGAGAGAGGYASAMGEEYGFDVDYDSMVAPELEMEEMYGEMYGDFYGEDASGLYPGGPGGTTSNRRGKGYPFVSVRGVFPFKNQIYLYSDAIHRGYADAVRLFELIDFQLERQELAIGSSEWTDWELVDIQVLRDVIESASGIEPDVVSAAVTDNVITCPLPTRLTGMWDRQATHERLKNFELSDAELDREMQFNRALLKEFMEQQADLPESEITRRGFSDMIFNSRSLQAGLFDAESEYDSAMMTGMYDYEDEEYGGYAGAMSGMRGMGGMRGGGAAGARTQVNPELERFAKELAEQFDDEEAAAEELQAWIVERATAEGELLLYRYLDFNVQPGYTYKYRVQLELRNPNYNMPISAAAGDLTVVESPTLPTPWSNETEPVRVDETVQYFLTRVDENRVRQLPDAKMHVYQWDTEIGTVVHDELTIEIGQAIGGEEEVVKIDAAKQTYEEEKYTFTSNDRLVDALSDLEFPRNEHPDLELPPGSRREAQIVEHALVAQNEDALVVLDPVSQARERRNQEKYVERQEELYSAWNRQTSGAFDGEMDDLYSELYGAGMFDDEEMEDLGGRRPRRNALRRGGGRGSGRGGSYPGYPGN